jgi:DNA modification methylase
VTGRVLIVQGDAARLPLPDRSVDLVVTSPPFYAVRSYEDDGTPIAGQAGSEADWRDYLETLWAWTAEWVRVLKPSGSLWVNLGDKYGERSHGPHRGNGTGRGPQGSHPGISQSRGSLEKSLLNLPARYAIGVTDRLGLVQRAEVIWQKPNPMPASVKDRVRQDHEHLYHFTPGRFYYSAFDVIREPHTMRPQRRPNGHRTRQVGGQPAQTYSTSRRDEPGVDGHPLGRLPGSVWRIPPYPLQAPRYFWRPPGGGLAWLNDDAAAWQWLTATGRDRSAVPRDDATAELRAAPDHHAAWPPALVRRIIAACSPERVCQACGQGRVPVTAYTGDDGRRPGGTDRYDRPLYSNLGEARLRGRAVTGWACECTPWTERPGPRGGPVRVYHPDGWEPPPSSPGVVLDPCSGTGTSILTAAMLGRAGIGVDVSLDYGRLATWRVADPAERAAALGVPKPPAQPDGNGAYVQGALLDVAELP